ncbi:hypothetical protein GCM10009682_19200 [Luedemannella flava]|uniref:Uncharacterized protein n=1 Tax=Luedemannella flava TaxID=349316 RepID=A0ABN2LRQ2_9ACTN
MTNITRRLLGLALAGGLAAGLLMPGGQASAAAEDVNTHRAQVAGRIDERLASLTGSTRIVAESEHLTRRHRAALTSIITRERAGLTRLRARVMAERTNRALRVHATTLTNSQDAFGAIRDKVRTVISADTDAATIVSLGEVRHRFVGRVAAVAATGVDTRPAQASLATLRTSLAQAGRLLRGQADAAIAARPAALARISRTVEAAHEQIRAALAASRAVRAFLAAHPPGTR